MSKISQLSTSSSAIRPSIKRNVLIKLSGVDLQLITQAGITLSNEKLMDLIFFRCFGSGSGGKFHMPITGIGAFFHTGIRHIFKRPLEYAQQFKIVRSYQEHDELIKSNEDLKIRISQLHATIRGIEEVNDELLKKGPPQDPGNAAKHAIATAQKDDIMNDITFDQRIAARTVSEFNGIDTDDKNSTVHLRGKPVTIKPSNDLGLPKSATTPRIIPVPPVDEFKREPGLSWDAYIEEHEKRVAINSLTNNDEMPTTEPKSMFE